MHALKKTAFFVPITAYFFVFALIVFASWLLIYRNEVKTDSSFSEIFFLLLKVSLAFTAIILITSLLFVLVSWIYFIYKKKKTGIQLNIDTEKNSTEQSEKHNIHIAITPILKPLFGFIKIRLLYDGKHFSRKFSLLTGQNKSWFSNHIEGDYQLKLPEIKEYRLQKAIIYFEDIFQFFSLAVSLPTSNNFFSNPVNNATNLPNVMPHKTEETNTRIDQMRKVEGEFLNYKNFENNDDVRRIVWKIYAKNKELVVRIPEIMDPYASHVYMYASFYSHFNIKGNETIEIPFLNFYKNFTWSVYQSLASKGFQVRYMPDHEVSKNYIASESQSVKYAISTSHWHTDKDLKSFVQTKDASVVIISSLSDAGQVQALTERHGANIRFILVKLTDTFRHQNIADWLQWVFIKNEEQDIDVYKRKWSLSAIKERIKDNERKLESILNKSSVENNSKSR